MIVDGAMTGLEVIQGHPTIVNSTFRGSHLNGMEFENDAGFGSDSAMVSSIDNGLYGVVIGIGQSDQLPAKDFSGNADGAAQVVGSAVTTTTTWTNLQGPYVPTQDLIIGGTPAPTLTLDPGVVVSASKVEVGGTAPGVLRAVGTTTQPVKFTGSPGWNGVWLDPMAGGSVLEHAVIENADTGVIVDSITPVLQDLTVTAQYGGVSLRKTAELDPSSTTLVLHAGTFAVEGSAQAITTLPSASSDYGGPSSAIWINGGTIGRSGSWHALGPPYVVNAMVNVQGSGSPVLTIEPGARVSFLKDAGLTVGEMSPGGLIAQGTSVAPIVFTGTTATPGYWAGLMFYTQTTATSVIANAVVEWGGESGFVGNPANIWVLAGAGPAIRDSTIWRSGGAGIEVACQTVGSAPPITNITYGTGADANASGDLVTSTCQ